MFPEVIDLRSDTVTKPTDEMREAMKSAEVGDDVHRDDPTVIELEELAADMMGKEAGLFVSSGTQGNTTSILTHTTPGEELILGKNCHIYKYEVGGFASLGGLSPRLIPDDEGYMDTKEMEESVVSDNIHHPETSLICIENTHNVAGGVPLSVEYTKEVSDIAKDYDLKLHLDGARIFNAATALDVDVKELTGPVDSVQFCLSKGLSAPIGSLIVGNEEFIERARKNRKRLGGAMRQVGVIAAPGIIALKKMTKRLEEDHKNARKLTTGLKKLGFPINPNRFQTNIIRINTSFLNIMAEEFCSKLKEAGILALAMDKYMVRFVTHREIEKEYIEYALDVIAEEFGDRL